jgi:uncharacterized protein (TIGR01777 family)
LKIAITGSHGLVGSALKSELARNGRSVIPVVRGEARPGQVRWDPAANRFDATPLEGCEVIVHLAGENIAGRRWNESVKEKIRNSRVQGTRVLSEGLAALPSRPNLLICASAIGFYGDRGEEKLTEESEPGSGFLASVVQQWEDACSPARDAGIQVLNLRFGVILSTAGGALAKMLTPFRFGVGGIVGSGKQYWSWIALSDVVGAIQHILGSVEIAGPVNVVSPQPVSNAEFTRILAHVLRRPAILPMPAFAARLALGEMADELLLASQHVLPQKLEASGYQFRQPTLKGALESLILGAAG